MDDGAMSLKIIVWMKMAPASKVGNSEMLRWENSNDSTLGASEPCLHNDIHEEIKRYELIPLTVLILITNCVVIGFIITHRKFRTPTYTFIASLGISDIFVGCISIVTVATKANEKTQIHCLLRIGFTIAAILASMFSLMSVAIDRYIAIMKALSYKRLMTKWRTSLGISAIWIVSILLGLLPIFGWKPSTYGQYCSFMYVLTNSYIITLFIVGAFIPMSVMLIVYVILFRKARFHIKRIQAIENLNPDRKNSGGILGISSRNLRSLKTFIAVFGCVVITWLPFITVTLVQIIGGTPLCFLKDIVGTHLLVLGFSNSFLNPFIYAVGTKDFRSNVRHLFRSRCDPYGSQIVPRI